MNCFEKEVFSVGWEVPAGSRADADTLEAFRAQALVPGITGSQKIRVYLLIRHSYCTQTVSK